MTQDFGFWTWPVDVAVRRSNAQGWVLIATLLYGLGAALLLLRFGVPEGMALLVLGVAASVFALCKVLLTRSRIPGPV